MKNIDMSTLSPEVAAYIRSLEETVLEQKMELVKLQSLTEQLVNLRKKMDEIPPDTASMGKFPVFVHNITSGTITEMPSKPSFGGNTILRISA